MSQDQPRSESHRSDTTRSESARSERSRSEKHSSASAMNGPFGVIGVRNVGAGLRLQKEMLEVFQDIGREWVSRAASEAELAFKLPNKLTEARSLPDAVSAYQQWLGEWMNLWGEDSRQLLSDSRKIIDTGVRCFAEAVPAGTS
jgi:hypothetical protein